jgi:glutathione S-transferase
LEAGMSDFVIHTIPGSPFARAVMATLEEKGAPWRIAPLSPGETKQQPYLSLHPFGRMPVLQHGDFTLYETQAILRYLDRTLAHSPLTPTDVRAAARMDQVMNISDWYLFLGGGNVIAFQRVVGPMLLGLTPDEAAVAEALPKAQVVFDELEHLLAGRSYFAGDQLSLADLAVAPLVDFLAMTPEWATLTAKHPNLIAWLGRMNERPSMQATAVDRLSERVAAA